MSSTEQNYLSLFAMRYPVSDFKQIRGGITFQDEIQRNSTGKLQRRSTRKWAEKHGKKSSKTEKKV